jgi:hypothetical protein
MKLINENVITDILDKYQMVYSVDRDNPEKVKYIFPLDAVQLSFLSKVHSNIIAAYPTVQELNVGKDEASFVEERPAQWGGGMIDGKGDFPNKDIPEGTDKPLTEKTFTDIREWELEARRLGFNTQESEEYGIVTATAEDGREAGAYDQIANTGYIEESNSNFNNSVKFDSADSVINFLDCFLDTFKRTEKSYKRFKSPVTAPSVEAALTSTNKNKLHKFSRTTRPPKLKSSTDELDEADEMGEYGLTKKEEKRFKELAKKLDSLKPGETLTQNEVDELEKLNSKLDPNAPFKKAANKVKQQVDKLKSQMGIGVDDTAAMSSAINRKANIRDSKKLEDEEEEYDNDFDEDEWDNSSPEREDIVIQSLSGNSWTANEFGTNKIVAQARTLKSLESLIKKYNEKEGYFPNVWIADRKGNNFSLYELGDSELYESSHFKRVPAERVKEGDTIIYNKKEFVVGDIRSNDRGIWFEDEGGGGASAFFEYGETVTLRVSGEKPFYGYDSDGNSLGEAKPKTVRKNRRVTVLKKEASFGRPDDRFLPPDLPTYDLESGCFYITNLQGELESDIPYDSLKQAMDALTDGSSQFIERADRDGDLVGKRYGYYLVSREDGEYIDGPFYNETEVAQQVDEHDGDVEAVLGYAYSGKGDDKVYRYNEAVDLHQRSNRQNSALKKEAYPDLETQTYYLDGTESGGNTPHTFYVFRVPEDEEYGLGLTQGTWTLVRGRVENSRDDNKVKYIKNTYGLSLKEGVVTNSKTGWFLVDKSDFVFDGPFTSKEIAEKTLTDDWEPLGFNYVPKFGKHTVTGSGDSFSPQEDDKSGVTSETVRKPSAFRLLAEKLPKEKKALLKESEEEARQEKSKLYTQYTSMDNGTVFSASTLTVPHLEAGVYKVRQTMQGTFLEKSVSESRSDEILEFEDYRYNSVINEVIKFRDLRQKYEDVGFLHKRGLLMYGAPGTGKTALVKKVIEKLVKSGDVVMIMRDHYEITSVIEMLNKVCEIEDGSRNVVVVLEEADQLSYGTETSFLDLMDGHSQVNHLLFLGTTNYLERMPLRMLRPGRFDTKVEVKDIPESARKKYFERKLSKLKISKEEIEKLVKVTEGFNFAQLREFVVLRYVYDQPLDESLAKVKVQFKDANV